MASSSRPDPESDQIREFVAWIDRAVEESLPTMEVASVLTEYALPNHRGLVSPFVYGSEGWYWPWNRVGFAYIRKERYFDAASIFSGAYLAALRIQHDYQERIHKGMPLCNVAYSFLRASEVIKARVPAALGMIEDLTTFGDATSTGNFANLKATGYPELMTQVLIRYASDDYRSKGRFPLYPEVVLYAMRWGSADRYNEVCRHHAADRLSLRAGHIRILSQATGAGVAAIQPGCPVDIPARRPRSWSGRTSLRNWTRSNPGYGPHLRIERQPMMPHRRHPATRAALRQTTGGFPSRPRTRSRRRGKPHSAMRSRARRPKASS